jgi:redox-sensitive bicupin YhaK (pirin superfamily)
MRRLEPGAAQVMSFSHDGDLHSERNASKTEPMRFIQFWILPSKISRDSHVQQHGSVALADRGACLAGWSCKVEVRLLWPVG